MADTPDLESGAVKSLSVQKRARICRNYSRIHTLKCAYVRAFYPRAKRSVTEVSGTNSRHTDTMTHTTCTVSTGNEE